jgi:hypothetical protein
MSREIMRLSSKEGSNAEETGSWMHDLTRDYETTHRANATDERDGDSSPHGGMSPLIRELILGYSLWGGKRTWDAAAFDRQGGSPRLRSGLANADRVPKVEACVGG